MKQFIGMLTLAATVGLMQRADAQEFNYNYLQVGVATASTKVQTGVPKASGQFFSLAASFEITKSVYATGQYSTGSWEHDLAVVDLDSTVLGLGLGYHFEPGESTSIYTQALYYPDYTLDVLEVSVVEGSAYGIALGLRQRVGERVELEGRFTHLQSSEEWINGAKTSGDSSDLAVGVLFHTGLKVSVGGYVGFDIDSDRSETTYGLGLRHHF